MNSENRLSHLDSLRGLAALAVVAAHSLNYLPEIASESAFFTTFLKGFLNGHSSVIIFFLISGFVLTYPYFTKKKQPKHIGFDLIYRFPRLLIPIFLIGLMAEPLQWLASMSFTEESYSQFFGGDWVSRWAITDYSLIGSIEFFSTRVLLFYDRLESSNINLWTMPVELVFSYFVFAIVCFNFRYRRLGTFTVLAALLFIYTWQDLYTIQLRRLIDGATFFIGAFLSLTLSRNSTFFGRTLGHIDWRMLSTAIVFLWLGGNAEITGSANLIFDFLASLILFLGTMKFSNAQLFANSMVKQLGHISFALYLIHGTILYCVYSAIFLLDVNFNYGWFFCGFVLSLFLSVIISVIFTNYVELFFLKIAKNAVRDGLAQLEKLTIRL